MYQWLPPTTAVIGITIIEVIALQHQVNGSGLAAAIGAIVAVVAYYFGKHRRRPKE